jgi:excisionase family DNA binding protein
MKQVFTIKEVAEVLSCSTDTIRRLVKSGEMKSAKVGSDYRISRSDLESYYRSQGGNKLFQEDK